MDSGYLVPPPLPPGVRNEIAAIMDKYELNVRSRRQLFLLELQEIDEKYEAERLPYRINELISDIETLKTSITAVAVIAFVYIVAKFAAVLKLRNKKKHPLRREKFSECFFQPAEADENIITQL